jgi:hypothetical protein
MVNNSLQYQGIDTLGKYAFDQPNSDISTSREALRCLANALLLNPDCRQIFVDLGYALKAAERFEVHLLNPPNIIAPANGHDRPHP